MIRLPRLDSFGWNERRDPGRVVVTLTPSRVRAVPVALAALLWNTALITMLVADGPRLMVVGGLHITFGLLIAYQALFRVAAVTRFTLTADALTVDHAFIPGPRARVAMSAVQGFDVEQVAMPWYALARFQTNHKTPWMLRVVVRRDADQTVVLSVLDAESLRAIAARLNALLDELRTPLGYRDERALPPAA
jgi:hypothetical protein